MKNFPALIIFFISIAVHAQTLKPYRPVPSDMQLQWHDLEFYLFMHFGPNTFTNLEWGQGTEHEEVFNPTQLDCRQWCRIAKAGGAKGIIITAKHHDGFCLWPSNYSTHTVAQSKWRNGKGDVLKELSTACKEYGLKLGIYLSPWDRNHPKYGTNEYNDVFVKMMKEVVTRYGPLFEFWWDGANGEGPNGKKQIYDWHQFEQIIRTVAPNTPVFSDIGPDIRWAGNEKGFAGTTNWNLLDTAGFTRGEGAPPTDTLNSGNINGKNWIPAECDVSIRPGWFYHASEDEKVKTPKQLFDLYLKSVGRGANLLLNVPPDQRGLINEHDSDALIEFRKLREENFKNNLLKNSEITFIKTNGVYKVINFNDNDSGTLIRFSPDSITIAFQKLTKLNCIVLQEPIMLGQRIAALTIQLKRQNEIIHQIQGTTVGRKRIICFPAQNIDSFTIIINNSKTFPLISEIAAYNITEELIEE